MSLYKAFLGVHDVITVQRTRTQRWHSCCGGFVFRNIISRHTAPRHGRVEHPIKNGLDMLLWWAGTTTASYAHVLGLEAVCGLSLRLSLPRFVTSDDALATTAESHHQTQCVNCVYVSTTVWQNCWLCAKEEECARTETASSRVQKVNDRTAEHSAQPPGIEQRNEKRGFLNGFARENYWLLL